MNRELSDAEVALGAIEANARRRMYLSQEPFIRDGMFYCGAWMEWRRKGGDPSDYMPAKQ